MVKVVFKPLDYYVEFEKKIVMTWDLKLYARSYVLVNEGYDLDY